MKYPECRIVMTLHVPMHLQWRNRDESDPAEAEAERVGRRSRRGKGAKKLGVSRVPAGGGQNSRVSLAPGGVNPRWR